MRDKIISVIQENPKHYSRIIRNNPDLNQWVHDNTLSDSDYYPALLRSALDQESDICEYGNRKQLKRFHTGFQGCGPAKSCQCTRDQISKKVSATKNTWSECQHKSVNQAREKTMLQKYGVSYNSQRSEVKQILQQPKIPVTTHRYLSDSVWLKSQYVDQKKSASEIAQDLNVYYGTVLDYCRQHGFDIRQYYNTSVTESQVADYIQDMGAHVERNNRGVLDGQELDIWIPEKNLAVEINGLYWHSHHPDSGRKENRRRHLEKSLTCAKAGITLLHITDYQWKHSTSAVKNILGSKMGSNTRIPARKCSVGDVSLQQEQEFLNLYHLQGWCPSSKKLGLWYQGNLVGLATFGRTRYDHNADAELLRLCFAPGVTVVGGVSRLMDHSGFHSVLSYTKNDLGFSQGLQQAGFCQMSQTGPGYFWTDGTQVISRYQSQKQKLETLLGGKFDPDLSESRNMFAAGYRRFWNTGNTKWIWRSQKTPH